MMSRIVAIIFTMLTIASVYAQDVEQLAKADPVAVSGGLTASGIYINHLQGRSLASSNDVVQSLRRTGVHTLGLPHVFEKRIYESYIDVSKCLNNSQDIYPAKKTTRNIMDYESAYDIDDLRKYFNKKQIDHIYKHINTILK